MDKNLNFYKNISKSNLPLTELLKNESLFYSFPENWSVVVADIENSTSAVNRGLHNDVNLSATGSIITVLNTLKSEKQKIKIPYFFGGDGATFIVPNSILEPILIALNNYRQHIHKTLDLNLRVGHLEVEKVYSDNVTLRIAKIRHNKYLTTPVVLGNGLKYAELLIKERFKGNETDSKNIKRPNLKGMECRWDEIYPNGTEKKVICLLVDCDDEDKQARIYGTIMEAIDTIFGNLEKRNPISTLKLKLDTSLAKIRKEMYAKLGKHNMMYLVSNWLITIIGSYYFKFFKSGKLYTYRVTQLSDTIMLDGFLEGNFIISLY